MESKKLFCFFFVAHVGSGCRENHSVGPSFWGENSKQSSQNVWVNFEGFSPPQNCGILFGLVIFRDTYGWIQWLLMCKFVSKETCWQKCRVQPPKIYRLELENHPSKRAKLFSKSSFFWANHSDLTRPGPPKGSWGREIDWWTCNLARFSGSSRWFSGVYLKQLVTSSTLIDDSPSLQLTWHLKMDGWQTTFLLRWRGELLVSGV